VLVMVLVQGIYFSAGELCGTAFDAVSTGLNLRGFLLVISHVCRSGYFST
jgi:hypothetical protein